MSRKSKPTFFKIFKKPFIFNSFRKSKFVRNMEGKHSVVNVPSTLLPMRVINRGLQTKMYTRGGRNIIRPE